MAKTGTTKKQKPKSKLSDKEQSERFKETAREVGADDSSAAFDRIIAQMGQRKSDSEKDHE